MIYIKKNKNRNNKQKENPISNWPLTVSLKFHLFFFPWNNQVPHSPLLELGLCKIRLTTAINPERLSYAIAAPKYCLKLLVLCVHCGSVGDFACQTVQEPSWMDTPSWLMFLCSPWQVEKNKANSILTLQAPTQKGHLFYAHVSWDKAGDNPNSNLEESDEGQPHAQINRRTGMLFKL